MFLLHDAFKMSNKLSPFKFGFAKIDKNFVTLQINLKKYFDGT